MSDYKLEITKKFSVPAEMIYDAWLDPEAIKKFMCPGDTITVPEPKIDARVGGTFLFEMHLGEKILPHKGEYQILERASKIQFTWNSCNTNNEDSLVTIEIKEIDKMSCELTLVHQLLPTESSKNDHSGGWENILKTLNNYLT